MISEKTLFELGIRTAYIKNGILHIDQFGNGNYIQDNQDNVSISEYGNRSLCFLIDNINKIIYPQNLIYPFNKYKDHLIKLIEISSKGNWVIFPTGGTYLLADGTTYRYNYIHNRIRDIDFNNSNIKYNNRTFVSILVAEEATYVIYSYFRNFYIAFLKPAP